MDRDDRATTSSRNGTRDDARAGGRELVLVRSREPSLLQQVLLARIWLPLAIVGVVIAHQLLIVPLGGDTWRFWSQLLFYSILGPAVTFVTLDWIASQIRQREEAQTTLRGLFAELQESHELLGSIQKVTERFAAATDLDATLSAAVDGIVDVTGATGVAVLLGASELGVTRARGLDAGGVRDALQRDRALAAGRTAGDPALDTGRVLSLPIVWGGRHEGSLHAYFEKSPSPEAGESFRILGSLFAAAAEATRTRTRDLVTLFEVDRSIRAEGNLGRLLSALLDQLASRAEATTGGVYLLEEGGSLRLMAWHGVTSPPRITTVRPGEGLIGGAAARREPCVREELTDDERAAGGSLLEGARSAALLPLDAEGETLGVIVLAHEQPSRFEEAALPILGLLAGQVSLAIRNARAYLQSEELAIAEERARIASEIHDGIAQTLAFTALKLDLVLRLLDAQPERARLELASAKGTIREMIREVRRSIFALRPVSLERYGFVETLRRYASDFGQQNDVRVDVTFAELPPLSAKGEAVLFRIFQEAMHNVAKHAAARTVRVTVGTNPEGHAFIAVEDDGRGFDPSEVSDRVTSAGGLGLRQMRERLQARGGTFRIESTPGDGTRVTATLPA